MLVPISCSGVPTLATGHHLGCLQRCRSLLPTSGHSEGPHHGGRAALVEGEKNICYLTQLGPPLLRASAASRR